MFSRAGAGGSGDELQPAGDGRLCALAEGQPPVSRERQRRQQQRRFRCGPGRERGRENQKGGERKRRGEKKRGEDKKKRREAERKGGRRKEKRGGQKKRREAKRKGGRRKEKRGGQKNGALKHSERACARRSASAVRATWREWESSLSKASPGVDCRPAVWRSVDREYTSNIRRNIRSAVR
eukprot:293133-Prorocentrum_minimum.AAC.2